MRRDITKLMALGAPSAEPDEKAVAIAIRNRWRRSQAPDDIRDEIRWLLFPTSDTVFGPGWLDHAQHTAATFGAATVSGAIGPAGPAARAAAR